MVLLILSLLHLRPLRCEGTAECGLNILLLALASSDLLCCIGMIPRGFFTDSASVFKSRSFQLFYRLYSSAFINTFMLSSTWLTVIMATSRYLAICHPFKARRLITQKATKISVVIAFAISFTLNVPRLFEGRAEALRCHDESMLYFYRQDAPFGQDSGQPYIIYIWIYFITGVAFPTTLLIFCNFGLISALRRSIRVRRQYRVPAAHLEANYRIMSMLVAIVVMHIVFMTPAEIIRFIRQCSDRQAVRALLIGIEVTNVLQTLNFAFNFVLYFVLNIHFRVVFTGLFVFRICSKNESSAYRSGYDRRMRIPLSATSSHPHTTHIVL